MYCICHDLWTNFYFNTNKQYGINKYTIIAVIQNYCFLLLQRPMVHFHNSMLRQSFVITAHLCVLYIITDALANLVMLPLPTAHTCARLRRFIIRAECADFAPRPKQSLCGTQEHGAHKGNENRSAVKP